MTSAARRLNLSVGINSTGYLGTSWKHRTTTIRDRYGLAYPAPRSEDALAAKAST